MKQFTVVGRYPNGKTVVAQVECLKASQAKTRAVQKIAFEVYDGRIPEGLDAMNAAITAVAKDFDLVAVMHGHVKPTAAKRCIFHGHES